MQNLFLSVFGLSLLLITACSSGDKSKKCNAEPDFISYAYYGASDNFKCLVPCISLTTAAGDSSFAPGEMEYTINLYKYDSLLKKHFEKKIEGKAKSSYADYPVSATQINRTIFSVIDLSSYKAAKDVDSAGISIKVKFHETACMVKVIPVENLKGEKPLMIIPGVKSLGNSVYELQLNTIRLAKRENEYLPSSEAMRVGINSAKGHKPIWSSNNGMNYLAVIKKVQPTEVGEIHINSIVFDKSADKVKSMPPGFYNISFLVPARPEVFSTEIECYLDK